MRIVIHTLLRAVMVVSLALTVAECVGKPAFRCVTDDACISSDGARGVCDLAGFCDFSKTPTGDASLPPTNPDTDNGACALDPVLGCYPCAATTSEQLTNACTSAVCVPFDDATRLTKLLSNGALPPLPN